MRTDWNQELKCSGASYPLLIGVDKKSFKKISDGEGKVIKFVSFHME